MSRIEQAEYTLSTLQCIKEFLGKWFLWLIISIVAGAGIAVVDYRSQRANYAEYEVQLADYQEAEINDDAQQPKLVDPVVAKAQLTAAEEDTVENALILYEVMEERRDYRDHSALNQLDANNATLMTLRYDTVSANPTADTEALYQFFLSGDFFAVLDDAVEQYRKEYVSEILSSSVAGTMVTVSIWLPADASENDVKEKINNSVHEFGQTRKEKDDTYVVSLNYFEVKNKVNQAITTNIQGSTGNLINAQTTLENYLKGMSENALAVYYAELGEQYYSKEIPNVDEVTLEEPEVVEQPKPNLLLVIGGMIAGFAFSLFGYICVQILLGKIYSQAVGRSMELDYSADLWIKEKAYGKEAERSSFDCVSENVNELGTARGICFVEVGETRAEMLSILSELEESVDRLISLDRMQILEQPVLTVADAIGSRETEIILLADVKRVRYGRLARVVYELRNLGFARISCICLH